MPSISMRAAGAALLSTVMFLGACSDHLAPAEGPAAVLQSSTSPSGVGITSVTLDSATPIVIGGAATPFTVTIGDPDGSFSTGTIQTEVLQGTASRVGGTLGITCGSGP